MTARSSFPTPATHVDWLAQWTSARERISELTDDSPEEQEVYEQIEHLSLLLATKRALSFDDLAAQVTWLKLETTNEIQSAVTAAHDPVFDHILKSVSELRDQSTTG